MTAAKQADQQTTAVTHRSWYHGPSHVGVVADEALVALIQDPCDVTGMMVTYQNAPFLLPTANAGLDHFASCLDTEPRASDVAAFQNDLRKHQVHLLLYNSQASDTAAQRMVRIAQQSNIPVVGVTETEPAGKTFQDWMMGQLNAVAQALSNSS